MKKTVYIVKQLRVLSGEFEELNVEAFLGKNLAIKYLNEQLESCSEDLEKYPNMSMDEDGFETAIYNMFGTLDDNILFSLDISEIDITNGIPDKVYLYTEINTYDSGEICPHALAFLTKEEAKKEMVSEINNRADEDADNYYWISDGDIEEDYVELEDEYGNTSYLECTSIELNSKIKDMRLHNKLTSQLPAT